MPIPVTKPVFAVNEFELEKLNRYGGCGSCSSTGDSVPVALGVSVDVKELIRKAMNVVPADKGRFSYGVFSKR